LPDPKSIDYGLSLLDQQAQAILYRISNPYDDQANSLFFNSQSQCFVEPNGRDFFSSALHAACLNERGPTVSIVETMHKPLRQQSQKYFAVHRARGKPHSDVAAAFIFETPLIAASMFCTFLLYLVSIQSNNIPYYFSAQSRSFLATLALVFR